LRFGIGRKEQKIYLIKSLSLNFLCLLQSAKYVQALI